MVDRAGRSLLVDGHPANGVARVRHFILSLDAAVSPSATKAGQKRRCTVSKRSFLPSANYTRLYSERRVA